jgi:hypothetical protein
MLDPDFLSDRSVIQASWRRVALSRAACIELNRQVAESRRLLRQSQRILAKSQADGRLDEPVSPAGECGDPRRFHVQATMISTIGGNGASFDEWCRKGVRSQHIPHAHAVPSERSADSTSGEPRRKKPMQQYPMRKSWLARPAEIGFRIASFALIGLIYAAAALVLWALWQEL